MDNNKGKGYDADVEAVKGLYHPISEKQEENIQHGEVRVCYLDKRTGEWKPVIKKKPKEQQNGRGWISVSYELLAHVLKLPKDVKITRVDAGLQEEPWSFRVALKGPGLPVIPEGSELPQVMASCTDHPARIEWAFDLIDKKVSSGSE